MRDLRRPNISPMGAASSAPNTVPTLKMATMSDDWSGRRSGTPFSSLKPVENCMRKDIIASIPFIVLVTQPRVSHVRPSSNSHNYIPRCGTKSSRLNEAYPVSYPNSKPPVATKNPTMMAGADEPATLSGFCQPMAIAMVDVGGPSIQVRGFARLHGIGLHGTVI